MGLAAVIALAAATPAGHPSTVLTPPPPPANSDFRLRTPTHGPIDEIRPVRLLTTHEDGDGWRTRLVAVDADAGRSGTPARRQRIAAGLSFRMVNDGGTLASNIGMSGAVGRALDRLAAEAMDAVAGDD